MACRDETVAAIVARPAQDRDGLRPIALDHRRGHGLAGSLHQIDTGDAACDGCGVGPPHLGTGQQHQIGAANDISERGNVRHDVRAIGAADRN